MPERKHTPRQPAELRVRGVRLVRGNRSNNSSDRVAYALTAEKLGYSRFANGAFRRRAVGPEQRPHDEDQGAGPKKCLTGT